MELEVRAPAGPGWGFRRRLGVRLTLAAVGAIAACSVVQAGPGRDCRAINDGALSVELGVEARAARQVDLKAGDRLIFSFEAPAGPFGTLSLVKGAGAPRSLLVGPSGTNASFVAAKAGAYAFEFSAESVEAASFAALCVPAGSAESRNAAGGKQRHARLLGPAVASDEGFAIDEHASVALDGAVPLPESSNSFVWSNAGTGVVMPATIKPGVEMKMQWRGERYESIGPDGLEIDTSTSGVDATVKYKFMPHIMVGALAQVDPATQSVGGTEHSLLQQGWMAGPVTNIKLGSGLTFDARAAWGVAEAMPDEFSARNTSIQRRMVSAKLANSQSVGPWRLTPSVTINHFQEAGGSSISPPLVHENAVIPYAAGAAGYGRVDVGPELAYRIEMDKAGFIEPRAAIGTFWDFDTLSKLTPGAAGHNDMRLKAEAGVTIGNNAGTKLQAGGSVEEGVSGSANVWSGRLQLSVPMR